MKRCGDSKNNKDLRHGCYRGRSWMVRAVSVLLLAVALISLATQEIQARPEEKPSQLSLAAALPLPQIPGLSGKSADWRQWDAFFTFVVKRFGQDTTGDLRDSLGAAFLDSRYELNEAIPSGGDPVPRLFVSAWNRLSPIMNKATSAMPKASASQYGNFISAANQLASVGQKGSQVGLVQFSPDALRGMARILEPAAAVDPLAYNLDVDSGLRNLIGFGSPLAAPRISPAIRQSRFYKHPFLPGVYEASLLPAWLSAAQAAEPNVKRLNEWVPDEKELQAYLTEVRELLAASSDKVAAKSKLGDEHKAVYRQIVFAAGWQESCWRQFIKKGKNLTPLASATGDLGLMQVNRNTWRGVYDLKGLGGDIEYNSNAGGEILLYYLTRFALKKNEDKQQGGNLARATYSAYNGGPGHLTRYRAAKQNPVLKKVDEAFWGKFQAVSAGRELDVQRCYQK